LPAISARIELPVNPPSKDMKNRREIGVFQQLHSDKFITLISLICVRRIALPNQTGESVMNRCCPPFVLFAIA
jgi:hypothetical protein